jgi:SAM-dependent MidA family methyltransferase
MSPLERKIRKEVEEHGEIAFTRFMELALYCPELGFYEREKDNVGRIGDFYTSVSVGPLFGELLGFQFARWFSEWGVLNAECGTLRLIEAGAHDGRLAGDILNWLRASRPEVFERTEYYILEPSPRRREWQQRALAKFAGQIHWQDSFPGNTTRNTQHAPPFPICFSNELLDAMPVRRFGWDTAKCSWFEWGVSVAMDRFIWTRMTGVIDPPSLGLPTSPELLEVLPDSYTMEVSPAAEAWWSAAANAVGRGKLLTFDYGFDADEAISPGRLNGTLRAYRQHKQVEDILILPGEQDITAHVDFGRIRHAGEHAGLKTDLLERQEQFLTRLASETWKLDAKFGDWDQKRTRQFQTLTHPGHLGRNFRVLIQSGAAEHTL